MEAYASVRCFVFIEDHSRREAARVFGLSRRIFERLRDEHGCTSGYSPAYRGICTGPSTVVCNPTFIVQPPQPVAPIYDRPAAYAPVDGGSNADNNGADGDVGGGFLIYFKKNCA